MADYAPNFTPRYRVRYISQSKSHNMTFRVARGTTDPTGIAGKVESFLAAIQGHLYTDWTVISATFALEDSDIFLPAPAPASPTGAASLVGVRVSASAVHISFPGRSTSGGRAIVYVYGSNYAPNTVDAEDDDFRRTGAEEAAIAGGVTALNELSPALVANDNGSATFYDYVNTKFNDHWVRKLRQG
jgi:hypothetical protein